MIYDTPYYFDTTRKIISCFGSMFSNIKVRRFETDLISDVTKVIDVPVVQSSKEKWWTWFNNPTSVSGDVAYDKNSTGVNKVQVQRTVPIIGYRMTNIEPDMTRKINIRNGNYVTIPGEPTKKIFQYQRAPYNFLFEVFLVAERENDMFQLTEQILPSFSPSFTFNIIDIPELALSTTIKVVLEGVSIDDDLFTGDMNQPKYIAQSLKFRCEGYFYMPITERSIIKEIDVNFRPNTLSEPWIAQINIVPDPIDAEPTEEYVAKITINEVY